MNAGVTCCETLWEALTWRVRLKGTSRWRKYVPAILPIASGVTSTRNGPPKLEWLVAKGFRGSIEWLLALSGSGGGRIIDPGQKICRIDVRAVAIRGVSTKTRNSRGRRRHSGAGSTISGIQIILVVAWKESS